MTQKLRNRDSGFTIIEVLIVLAIAGLILLIVFLAVPALQRSSRNTQRKNDAASLLGAVSNYISNNNGATPQTVGTSGNDVLFCGAACGTGNTENAKVGFYTNTNVALVTAIPGAFPDTNHITVLVGYKCPAAAGTLPAATDANGKTAVALFSLENGSGGQTNICQEQ